MSPALSSRTARPSRAARTVGVALALALGLSGCGAGLRAQTYQERTMSDSTNEAVGALSVRHIRVLPPQGAETHAVGSDARVALVVVNEGVEDDRLVSVTSDAAASVDVIGQDGRPGAELVVPPNAAVSQYAFVLRGLTRPLRPGQYVQMQLTFERNGSETMLVPVELTGTPGPRREGYEVAHVDSNGVPIVKEHEGEEHGGDEHGGEKGVEPGAGTTEEGSSDRPELDNDGADAGSGDQAPDPVGDPSGDENGGAGATSPPLEEQ